MNVKADLPAVLCTSDGAVWRGTRSACC